MHGSGKRGQSCFSCKYYLEDVFSCKWQYDTLVTQGKPIPKLPLSWAEDCYSYEEMDFLTPARKKALLEELAKISKIASQISVALSY